MSMQQKHAILLQRNYLPYVRISVFPPQYVSPINPFNHPLIPAVIFQYDIKRFKEPVWCLYKKEIISSQKNNTSCASRAARCPKWPHSPTGYCCSDCQAERAVMSPKNSSLSKTDIERLRKLNPLPGVHFHFRIFITENPLYVDFVCQMPW